MVVERPEWWDRADIRQIAGMDETAQQWRQFDPRAQAAADTIAREVKDRYGVDVDNLGADPQAVRAALAQVELDQDLAARGERETAATEYTQAALAVQEADHLDARAAAAQLGPEAGDNGDRSADTSRSEEAARLELQAREYELLATQGETPEQSPAQLMDLASDARSQAQLHRDAAQGAKNGPTASVSADQGRASAERSTPSTTAKQPAASTRSAGPQPNVAD